LVIWRALLFGRNYKTPQNIGRAALLLVSQLEQESMLLD
jgi:hypothetical protein